jgi:DEAD/DEAH box helicase domain-containing protein
MAERQLPELRAKMPSLVSQLIAALRMALGQHLKRHQLFVNLLPLMKGGVVSYTALEEAFARNMPAASRPQVARVLDALLVLVAWALREGQQPLVTLRLRSERGLPGQRDGVYLPMVQCSQCRTTGWLSRLVQGSNKLSTQLDEIYSTWFSRRRSRGGWRGGISLSSQTPEG